MADLKLRLFGVPQFEFQGQPVEGLRRKALALAAYLALNDRAHTREALAALFWPDQDEEHSRMSLRSNLYNLTSLAPVNWLDADRQTVRIKFDSIDIDARLFISALARTRAHLHSDGVLCDTCYQVLDEAVSLYNEELLAGFSLPDSDEFDHWQTAQRAWFSRECVGALKRLAEHTAARSSVSLQEAITYGRRWLSINALDEGAHRLLMRLFAANGQRGEAIRQYQECVRLLDTELATLPEVETVTLYETIINGESVTAPQASARAAEPIRVTYVLPPLPSLMVGRETTLAELRTRLGIGTGETHRPITMIEGWPGVGKSTTIAALAHEPALKLAFPDGVLWTSLGEEPNIARKLLVWADALHLVPPGKTPKVDELTARLTTALKDRRMLLIVDDVWQVEHAAPFRVGGGGCALLMSSRLNHVARALAPISADVYRLPVLSDEYGLALLSHLAPKAAAEHPDEALQLVRDLEGLPLALQVAGRLLNEEAHLGWGVVELLAELRSGVNLLLAQAPNDMAQTDSYTVPTVLALLKRSTDTLDPEMLFRFSLLSLFSAKPATFDLAALAATWEVSDPKPTVRALVNRGLLEPLSGGRFQMHALLVVHAKGLLEGMR